MITNQEQMKIDALVLRLATLNSASRRRFEGFFKKKIREELRGGGFGGETYFTKRVTTVRSALIAWEKKFRVNGKSGAAAYTAAADAQAEKIEGTIRLNPAFRSADSVDQMVLVASMTLLAIVLQNDSEAANFSVDSWNILAGPWSSCEGPALFLL